jgi:hypothetical protein
VIDPVTGARACCLPLCAGLHTGSSRSRATLGLVCPWRPKMFAGRASKESCTTVLVMALPASQARLAQLQDLQLAIAFPRVGGRSGMFDDRHPGSLLVSWIRGRRGPRDMEETLQ